MNKRILLGVTALVVVAAPAAFGLWGNASFAQSVPVRVPASVATPTPSASIDDHGGDLPRDQRTEPGDDRDDSTAGTTAPASPSVDDHGGDLSRDARVEPGDDRDATGSAADGATSTDSGHGSDDSGRSTETSGGDDSPKVDDGSGHGDESGDDSHGDDSHGDHGDDGGHGGDD